MKTNQEALFEPLRQVFGNLDFKTIPDARRAALQPLIDYLRSRLQAKAAIRLNFICTHNSRRSHLSQAWAQAAAAYYGIPGVACYSGGTEATALFPEAARALETAGFQVLQLSQGPNPVYAIKYGANEPPVIGFSKTYDAAFNPRSGFAAVMTCSEADAGCPFVAGAEKRFPITYEDPKAFDGTPLQREKYLERSLQIATEMAYIFSLVSK